MSWSPQTASTFYVFFPQTCTGVYHKANRQNSKKQQVLPRCLLIHALENLSPASSSADKKGVLYSLCGQFDKQVEYTTKKADHDKLLYKIFAFVEENFCSDCSLLSLSKKTGYDYSYLSRHFKKIVGISFNSYVTHYRLSYACYLMENTEQTILQCAYNSGFASLRNFKPLLQRPFKNHTYTISEKFKSEVKFTSLLLFLPQYVSQQQTFLQVSMSYPAGLLRGFS